MRPHLGLDVCMILFVLDVLPFFLPFSHPLFFFSRQIPQQFLDALASLDLKLSVSQWVSDLPFFNFSVNQANQAN